MGEAETTAMIPCALWSGLRCMSYVSASTLVADRGMNAPRRHGPHVGSTRVLCVGRSCGERRLVFLVPKMRDAALIACYPPQKSLALFTNVRGCRPATKGRAQINIM